MMKSHWAMKSVWTPRQGLQINFELQSSGWKHTNQMIRFSLGPDMKIGPGGRTVFRFKRDWPFTDYLDKRPRTRDPHVEPNRKPSAAWQDNDDVPGPAKRDGPNYASGRGKEIPSRWRQDSGSEDEENRGSTRVSADHHDEPSTISIGQFTADNARKRRSQDQEDRDMKAQTNAPGVVRPNQNGPRNQNRRQGNRRPRSRTNYESDNV